MRINAVEILKIIEAHRDCVDFCSVPQTTTEDMIRMAEQELGLPLPASYKWFVATFGGGSIKSERILGVYGKSETVCAEDIVHVNLINRRHGIQNARDIVICDNDGDEIFVLDTSIQDEHGEYPVVRIDHIEGTRKPYAQCFLDFLRKRILFRCDHQV